MKKFLSVLLLTGLISVFACGCGNDPYSIKVEGKKYTFNAEWGIQNLGKMPGLGEKIGYNYNKRDFFIQDLDGEEVDYEDINATLYYSPDRHLFGSSSLQMYDCEFENGCEMGRGPGWKVLDRFSDMNFVGFDITFCNNYNYLGITNESSAKDIKEAGFQRYGQNDEYYYYRIDCKKKLSEEKLDELYKDLLDMKPRADEIAEDFETGEYFNYALSLVPVGHADFLKFSKDFREITKNEVIKDTKSQLKLAIEFSYYLKMLDEGKIDSFVLSFATDKGVLDYTEGKKKDDTAVEVIVFASRDKAEKWAEKWGWEEE